MGCTSSSAGPVSSPGKPETKKVEGKGSAKGGGFNFKPIHSAVRWNSKPIEEIEQLLNSPEAVNCVDTDNGNRPIHIAAQNGHLNVIELLIRKNAELDVLNGKGNTAYHMALGYDYYDVAMALSNAGARTDIVNEAGSPGYRGLEGDKTLGIAAFISATSTEQVEHAFRLCEGKLDEVDKVQFIQAGLKQKKALGAAWTPAIQDKFREISKKL